MHTYTHTHTRALVHAWMQSAREKVHYWKNKYTEGSSFFFLTRSSHCLIRATVRVCVHSREKGNSNNAQTKKKKKQKDRNNSIRWGRVVYNLEEWGVSTFLRNFSSDCALDPLAYNSSSPVDCWRRYSMLLLLFHDMCLLCDGGWPAAP